jgi:outer membrane receptor for ferric coprogen and ferric-rhodotorulic acid
MENIDRRFIQSVLHEYNEPQYGINWDAIPQTYVLPGLKSYRIQHAGGDWIHDMRISYQISKELKASFIVNNVGNAEYCLRPGDVRAPRMFLFQLMIKI